MLFKGDYVSVNKKFGIGGIELDKVMKRLDINIMI
jgi:hypothetical protein